MHSSGLLEMRKKEIIVTIPYTVKTFSIQVLFILEHPIHHSNLQSSDYIKVTVCLAWLCWCLTFEYDN